MIPGQYSLTVYQGDSYYGPLITLPDLSSFGGPSDLTTATVTAQIRQKVTSAETLAEFTVDVVDDEASQLRLKLDPADTAAITAKEGVWDLQVEEGEWIGTPLAGKVTFVKEVTRPVAP